MKSRKKNCNNFSNMPMKLMKKHHLIELIYSLFISNRKLLTLFDKRRNKLLPNFSLFPPIGNPNANWPKLNVSTVEEEK